MQHRKDCVSGIDVGLSSCWWLRDGEALWGTDEDVKKYYE